MSTKLVFRPFITTDTAIATSDPDVIQAILEAAFRERQPFRFGRADVETLRLLAVSFEALKQRGVRPVPEADNPFSDLMRAIAVHETIEVEFFTEVVATPVDPQVDPPVDKLRPPPGR